MYSQIWETQVSEVTVRNTTVSPAFAGQPFGCDFSHRIAVDGRGRIGTGWPPIVAQPGPLKPPLDVPFPLPIIIRVINSKTGVPAVYTNEHRSPVDTCGAPSPWCKPMRIVTVST